MLNSFNKTIVSRNRPFVVENKKLSEQFDIEAMRYTDVTIIKTDFRNNFLFKNDGFDKRFSKGINKKLLKDLFNLLQSPDSDEKRAKLWRIHDENSDKVKSLIALLGAFWVDEDEFVHSTEENGYSTVGIWFLNPLFHTYVLGGADLCHQHADFIAQHPEIQKYKK